MKNTKEGTCRIYRCGKCGVAPKKGHVCLGSRPPATAVPSCLPSASGAPAQQQHTYEDDMEDEDDDALPPAPPALLQLRPLSEVSKRIAEA